MKQKLCFQCSRTVPRRCFHCSSITSFFIKSHPTRLQFEEDAQNKHNFNGFITYFYQKFSSSYLKWNGHETPTSLPVMCKWERSVPITFLLLVQIKSILCWLHLSDWRTTSIFYIQSVIWSWPPAYLWMRHWWGWGLSFHSDVFFFFLLTDAVKQ